jgi:hypothetical protein
MYECTICGDSFKSQKGLSIHFSKKCAIKNYEESLYEATATCPPVACINKRDIIDSHAQHYSDDDRSVSSLIEGHSVVEVGTKTTGLDEFDDAFPLPDPGGYDEYDIEYEEDDFPQAESGADCYDEEDEEEEEDDDLLVVDQEQCHEEIDDENDSGIDDLLCRRKTHLIKDTRNIVYGTTDQSCIELLSILQSHQAPVAPLYIEINKWVRNWQYTTAFDYNPKPKSSLISSLESRFDYSHMHPKTIQVTLPKSSEKVPLTIHSFEDVMYSLLRDEYLMQDDNLLFHNNNPFAPPPTQTPEVYYDINDGENYRNAYNLYCSKQQDEAVLCPIILFVDKTHVDTYGRLTLEPVNITLGIFKKEVRQEPRAWRTLGYIPNMTNVYTRSTQTLTPRMKMFEYHLMLGIVLQSLKRVQKLGGIKWKFHYQGRQHKVIFKCPVLFIVGDSLGHDQLCARYLNRQKSNRLCRYCNVPMEETDNPFFHFRLTKAADVSRAIANKDSNTLKDMSQHLVENNAFNGIQFCDPDRGLHGATPAELLHVFQKGLFTYYLEGLFDSKRVLSKQGHSRKEAKEQQLSGKGGGVPGSKKRKLTLPARSSTDTDNVHDDWVYHAPVDSSLSGIKVFTSSRLLDFDASAIAYGKLLQRQSDREFARAFFPSGITSNSKKFAHEAKCVILLCLLILVGAESPKYERYLNGDVLVSNSNRHAAYIELGYALLLFESFLKETEVPKSILSHFERYVPKFLDFFKEVVSRDTGMGMSLTKFHLPLHIASDIRRNGPATSWDSSFCESHHKNLKKGARSSQFHFKVLEKETSNRLNETYVVERAYEEQQKRHGSSSALTVTCVQRGTMHLSAMKYRVNEDGIFSIDRSKRLRAAHWVDDKLMNRVCSFVQDMLLQHVPSRFIDLYTLMTEKSEDGSSSTIYHTNPEWHRDCEEPTEHWHDWANIEWSKGTNLRRTKILPARLVIFMKIPDWDVGLVLWLEGKQNVPGTSCVRSAGDYVIVESAIQDIYVKPKYDPTMGDTFLAHPSQNLIYHTYLEADDHDHNDGDEVPFLKVARIDMVHSPRIAVPWDISHALPIMEWMIIESRIAWSSLFKQEMTIRNSET